ncbi:hypothetical protein TIFTF001_041658 [Ficus carica]|uniref:GTD-binding domain-containing protein n=1 Tax=Ficus carica TaxID=3494 RepID=A0AA87ZDK1_FICCA|nr:hypothetical protein TIFTF001_041651 [Ficus carica]GMN31902.1 hypothetical protein TIFTF001_041652 [Ficus carica]GMN31922.1 hypothetical protein TIFTF001_041657 [Ficus carica]GMN31937.1 hypothetical protein TIFTF001_041658 [Ficus carica]
MGEYESSMVEENRNLLGFMAALSYAASEWFLIFMLLVNAVLSYLLTKFADYCKLQIPCILCSRIDHVIGSGKPRGYRNLLCSNHILEISSSICCHVHSKYADGQGMCDDCFFSSARKNSLCLGTQRIMGGKLETDIGNSGLESLLLNRDFARGSGGTVPCSCCGKPWRPRNDAQRLPQPNLCGSVVPKPNIPLPRLPSHNHLHRRNSIKKMKNKFYGSTTSRCVGKSGFDPLSHVGYTELKNNSDTESEVPFSDEDDDDDERNAIRENSKSQNDFADQCPPKNPSKVPSSDFVSAKLSNCPHESRPLLSDLCVQPDVNRDHHAKSLAFDGATEDFVGELRVQEVRHKPNLSTHPELILLDEIPESTNVSGPSDLGQENNDNHKEVLKSLSTQSVTLVTTDQVHNYPSSETPRNTDANDLCEQDGSYVEGESSGSVSELPITREPDTLDEELQGLRLLLSLSKDILDQASDLSSNNRILGEHDHGEDVHVSSSSKEILMLRKSSSAESSLESLDVQNVSDIEGESLIDRLKRQVEYDRKCITTLYKELEEERNASAVAANQAMAMITRLQEEKAALHMEALQYLRMMEEQAEYDVDALEKANDLLAEKEKEIQDMEAELELYKLDLPDEKIMGDLHEETFEVNIKSKKVESGVIPCQDDTSLPLKPVTDDVSRNGKEHFAAEISYLEFADEKLYISQCLQNLEMQLHHVYGNRTFFNIPNGVHSKTFADDRLKGEESPKNEDILLNSQVEECDSSMEGDLHLCNGNTAALEDTTASDGDDSSCSKATKHCDCNGRNDSPGQGEISLVALEHEISDLNDRLEGLEADRDFLEHMLHYLQNGTEGLQFIQEVAHQLQELGKLGVRLRSQYAP